MRKAWLLGLLVVGLAGTGPARLGGASSPKPAASSVVPASAPAGAPSGEQSAGGAAPTEPASEQPPPIHHDESARGSALAGAGQIGGGGGLALDDSGISFEMVLLVAAVVANYLLLAVVLWSYWKARRQGGLGSGLPQKLDAIVRQLEAIEGAVRSGSAKPSFAPPAPALPASTPRATGYDTPREQPAPRPAPRPAPKPIERWSPDVQEPDSPPARTRPASERRRSQASAAWDLVTQYCLNPGSSILDLGQQASALGLQIGSPSSTRGQRHFLEAPDKDSRLLAIKDNREERFFVVVGADATVAETEWLDLFQRRSFPGVSQVRSKVPAVVNAVTGEVDEKGELEVFGST